LNLLRPLALHMLEQPYSDLTYQFVAHRI
jgi:hypothetical protein